MRRNGKDPEYREWDIIDSLQKKQKSRVTFNDMLL